MRIILKREGPVRNLSRRGFIAAAVAVAAVRAIPIVASNPSARRILTLVYDGKLGMMRAIDRLVP